MASTSTYYDKVFRQPKYIWNSGQSDVNLISSTIEGRHLHRLQWLAKPGAVRMDVGGHESTSTPKAPPPSTGNTAVPQADKAANAIEQPPRNSAPPSPGATRNVVVPLLSLVWNGAEPQNYVRLWSAIATNLTNGRQEAQFRIGTDPVPFLLDIDTGSSLLWVQARLSTDDPTITDQSQYNPTTSKTARNANQNQDVNYGDGSRVKATLFTDNVRVEKLLAENQSIGAVSSQNLSPDAVKGKSNGLIGLGFAKDESTGFVQTLQRQDAIRYASISLVGPRNNPKDAKKIDQDQIMEPRGYLIIGSVDHKYYTGEIAWCPQISNFDAAVPDRWIVKLDAILLNGVEIQEFTNQFALIDTGTSYIVTSPNNMTTFRHKVGAGARPLSTSKPYMWAYPSKPTSSITSISFKLGGRTIELHPGDFSLGQYMAPDKEGVIRSVSSICTLPNNSWPFKDNLWVLGGIFLDNVLTIFDFGARKVGFADISEHDLAQDLDAPASKPQ